MDPEESAGGPIEKLVRYPHPLLAREGWPIVCATVAGAAATSWLAGWWSVPLWLAAAFTIQFFRDPPRTIPGDERSVVSPADGRVVAVETVRDPYLDRDALKVSVFMNVFNVHANRSPVDGTVRMVWYNPGRFLNASLDKASLENERSALWLESSTGADVTCVQVAGLIARRVLCYAKAGDHLSRGERFGFIRFGSRVDVYLPPGTILEASLGDKVLAGSSILARI